MFQFEELNDQEINFLHDMCLGVFKVPAHD